MILEPNKIKILSYNELNCLDPVLHRAVFFRSNFIPQSTQFEALS